MSSEPPSSFQAPDLQNIPRSENVSLRAQNIQQIASISKNIKTKQQPLQSINLNAIKQNQTQQQQKQNTQHPFERIPQPILLQNMGGIDYLFEQIYYQVEMAILNPEIFQLHGCSPPVGILIVGAPGTGKTSLANAIYNQLQAKYVQSQEYKVGTVIDQQTINYEQSVVYGSGQNQVKIQDPSNREQSDRMTPVVTSNQQCSQTTSQFLGKQQAQIYFQSLSATELVSSKYGESEQNIYNLFQRAIERQPSYIIIDNIEIICTRNENGGREFERRVLAALCAQIDQLKNHRVIVVATTVRAQQLDLSIRRNGRFDTELQLLIPDRQQRRQILQKCLKEHNFTEKDIETLANMTPGFVPADIQQLIREAVIDNIKGQLYQYTQKLNIQTDSSIQSETEQQKQVIKNVSSDYQKVLWQQFNIDLCNLMQYSSGIKNYCLTDDKSNKFNDNIQGHEIIDITEPFNPQYIQLSIQNFKNAIKYIQPTTKKEGFAQIPECSMDCIGGLEEVKEALFKYILRPIQQPELYKSFGLKTHTGVVLTGAPGNGKSLLGRAVAGVAECNFISVRGPELLNQYVGESERAVRVLFERARAARPVVLFLDECECLCRQRGTGNGSDVTDRIVNQFLTELDGVESDREGIYVIAATNRLDLIDRALMRSGRLERAIYVPFPGVPQKVDIIRKMLKEAKTNLSDEFLFNMSSQKLEGFSGADIAALVREASLAAINVGRDVLEEKDFVQALKSVKRTVSQEDFEYYETFQAKCMERVDMDVKE